MSWDVVIDLVRAVVWPLSTIACVALVAYAVEVTFVTSRPLDPPSTRVEGQTGDPQ